MYEAHFGLRKPLFQTGIVQESAVFLAARHQQLAASIKLALTTFDSAVVLTGAAGVGKTALMSTVLRTTSTKLALGWITVAPQNAAELLELLLVEFGFNAHRVGRVERMQMWRQFLNEMSATSSRVYVIAERAEDLGADVLRALDSLTAADPNGSLGANLVLLGQPALLEVLKASTLTSLCQRIRLRQRLEPLSLDELRAYLDHHAKAAGGTLDKLFARDALAALHEITNGVPRLANNVAETALTLAATRETPAVTAQLLREVAEMFGIASAQAPASPAEPQRVAEPAAPVAPAARVAPAASASIAPRAPVAAQPAPFVARPAPVAAQPASAAAQPASVAEQPAPVAAHPAPVTTQPAAAAAHIPIAAKPAPAAPPAPITTKTAPFVAQPIAPAPRAGMLAHGPAPTATAAATPHAAAMRAAATAAPVPPTRVATTSLDPSASMIARRPAFAAAPVAPAPAASVPTTPALASPAHPAAAASPVPSALSAAPAAAQPRAAASDRQLMSDEEIDSFAATLTESPDVQTLDFPVLTDAVDPPRQRPRAETAYVKPPAARAPAPEPTKPPLPRVVAAASTPSAARPAMPPQPAAKPAPPAQQAASEDADVLRQTQTMRAIAVAKSIDDISNSMAETLFGEDDLAQLNSALAASGWTDDDAAATSPAAAAPAPTAPATAKLPPQAPAARPAPPPVARPAAPPPVAKAAVPQPAAKPAPPADDDPFDFLGLGRDAPLELIDDEPVEPQQRKEAGRNR
jgi:general secretion pathway protein A